MFRHVAMFRWRAESGFAARQDAIAQLHAFAADVSDLGSVQVGVDAGIQADNFDAVVVADFADRERYLAYAADPRHVALIGNVLKPIVAERAAVQTGLD
jgi:hypothetical protein